MPRPWTQTIMRWRPEWEGEHWVGGGQKRGRWGTCVIQSTLKKISRLILSPTGFATTEFLLTLKLLLSSTLLCRKKFFTSFLVSRGETLNKFLTVLKFNRIKNKEDRINWSKFFYTNHIKIKLCRINNIYLYY